MGTGGAFAGAITSGRMRRHERALDVLLLRCPLAVDVVRVAAAVGRRIRPMGGRHDALARQIDTEGRHGR